MPSQLEEITAVYRAEIVRREDWCLAKFEQSQAAAGNLLDTTETSLRVPLTAEPGELETGLTYRLFGRWTYTQKYGRQFKCVSFVRAAPHGREGVIRYLQKAPHVGRITAKKLWDKFSGDAVRILREEPDVAAAATAPRGLTLEQATQAAEWLDREKHLESCTIELVNVLGGRGFPRTVARKAIGKWGNRAAERIQRDPYQLLQFRGCGFLKCDAMYLDLGLPAGKLKRQALCATYCLQSDTSGSTWMPVEDVVQALKRQVGGAEVQPAKALMLAKRAKLIATRRDGDDKLFVALWSRAINEATIAVEVRQAMPYRHRWPEVSSQAFQLLTGHQAETLHEALSAQIAILAGSPGTGKTFTAACLIRELVRLHGSDKVAVCAPTGKAAVRITQAMRDYGIELDATTIHSLLEVASGTGGGGWSFGRSAEYPLDQQYVIVDEASMPDADLMAALLSARPEGGNVLLVGDTNQLPPVGHGAPLRDLIGGAGVSWGELREIRRNAGAIVETCAAIRDRKPLSVARKLDLESGTNLALAECPAEQLGDRVTGIIEGIQRRGQRDPIWDVQVIVALNEKSYASRKELNERLQGMLNPAVDAGGASSNGRAGKYRVRDKVICLKNGIYAGIDASAQEEAEHYLANGELGRVEMVDDRGRVLADFDGRRAWIYGVRSSDSGVSGGGDSESAGGLADRFDLAYAITCHKSQGSEVPVAIVVLDEAGGARWVCSRQWLYTAISRAKEACILVGRQNTAAAMCRRDALVGRKTFLRELIVGNAARLSYETEINREPAAAR